MENIIIYKRSTNPGEGVSFLLEVGVRDCIEPSIPRCSRYAPFLPFAGGIPLNFFPDIVLAVRYDITPFSMLHRPSSALQGICSIQ